MTDILRAAIQRLLPQARTDLETLVRIPSVAFPGFDHGQVQASAEAVAALCREVGMPDVKIVAAGGQPAVIAKIPAPPGAPTVLLYAHHDVQPAGRPEDWNTEPFEPTQIGDRLYGRGCADDKAGVVAHLTAIRAFDGRPPVGVILFIEGEEEFGSGSLPDLLAEYVDDLRADVIVIADSVNWDIGVPSLTTSLRGLVDCYVEVAVLDHAVHSGMWGGPIPDALTALSRLLATLHEADGSVAVKGLHQGETSQVDYPEERFRAESGVLDGVQLIGRGSLTERMWYGPAIAVTGIDCPSVREASNTLVPSARAKVSMRIAPGQDPAAALEALVEHLESHAPWGARVTVTRGEKGAPCVIGTDGPAHEAARLALREAWEGVEPIHLGVGGSIPFIAEFAETFPQAEILVTGVEDPDSRAHGANESLHLGEFARVCLAESLLLASLAPRR
ncbi:MAG: dipeptidase [Longispora sp.]|nr:dipeptidase [Longispora sp. (in: high G+C Gram-positive bacteria)]